jgi:hypothetical protein
MTLSARSSEDDPLNIQQGRGITFLGDVARNRDKKYWSFSLNYYAVEIVMMKTVILRTPKRTKSNSFSDAFFRTYFFGRTFSDADRGAICWSV